MRNCELNVLTAINVDILQKTVEVSVKWRIRKLLLISWEKGARIKCWGI